MIKLRGIVDKANLQCITIEKVHKNLMATIMGFVGQFFFIKAKAKP